MLDSAASVLDMFDYKLHCRKRSRILGRTTIPLDFGGAGVAGGGRDRSSDLDANLAPSEGTGTSSGSLVGPSLRKWRVAI